MANFWYVIDIICQVQKQITYQYLVENITKNLLKSKNIVSRHKSYKYICF